MSTPLRLLCAAAAAAATSAPAGAQCQIQKAVPPDGVFYQQTGETVAVDGDIAVLGAPFDNDLGSWTGAAYVYERQAGHWIVTAKLHASDAAEEDRFAFSVAVDGGVIVCGTRYKQDMGYGTGAAYVYEKVGGVWTETKKLLAHDVQIDQFFGQSVSVAGDLILVGAHLDDELGFSSGAAYVFERSGATWVETQRLTASDGALDDRFGWDVAATPDVLFISSHGSDIVGPNSGAAYVFHREGGVFVEKKKLIPADPKPGARFGYSLDVDGEWAVVGSPFDDTHGAGSGAAYLYRYNGNTWLQVQKLTASDGLSDDLFGEQVAIEGTLLISSAWAADGAGMDTGAAYLFRNTGTTWIEKARLAPTDVADFDTFGKAVDVSGDTALAGSPQDDDLADRVGAGYFFSAEAIGCPDLYAEPGVIHAAMGGSQYFTLRPPVGQAGDFYYMLGSASGTQPGFSFGAFLIPLNPDPYLKITLLYPNEPPLTTSFAPLSASVTGTARFTLPPISEPVLTGLTVSHAYGVFNAATLDFLYVSKASHLTFL